MRNIAVDAGPLIGLFNRSDAQHKQATDFLRRAGDFQLITTSLVIGEVAAILSGAEANLLRFLDWLGGGVEIDDALSEDLPQIIAIMKKYHDLPPDLADASLIALCERRSIKSIATLDSDFQVYRLSKGRKFENVFLPPVR